MGILQLVSTFIDKLHLANLVDAYAELIKANAYKVTVQAFSGYALMGTLFAMVVVCVVGLVITCRADR